MPVGRRCGASRESTTSAMAPPSCAALVRDHSACLATQAAHRAPSFACARAAASTVSAAWSEPTVGSRTGLLSNQVAACSFESVRASVLAFAHLAGGAETGVLEEAAQCLGLFTAGELALALGGTESRVVRHDIVDVRGFLLLATGCRWFRRHAFQPIRTHRQNLDDQAPAPWQVHVLQP